jgi:hypothetical protein
MTGPRTAPMGDALRAIARHLAETGASTAPRPRRTHADTMARLTREGWLEPAPSGPGGGANLRWRLTDQARAWLSLPPVRL